MLFGTKKKKIAAVKNNRNKANYVDRQIKSAGIFLLDVNWFFLSFRRVKVI